MTEEKPQETSQELDQAEQRIKELEEKVSKLEQTARAVNQRYVELQREFEYLRERYRKDLEEVKKYGHEKLALDLLEVVDNFERAFEYEGQDLEAFKRGFELIYGELLRILEKHGVKEIELLGKEFDPYLAEAVDRQYEEKTPPNTVLRVERKGYFLHERVLRPARVVVSYAEEEIS
ncbi:MAG: nucleotide exchange factor GrpE [Aquificaceae bacterium]|nr:nucleotide exchange factor GrpE [Aquificaceae bacterium]MCX8059940.1 nucleotide exchange factor GrpE [Aquificaceae bacterium]MDW8096975.1 nucleotide exchange factor GrpE [Aquificaceae bacterium]